MSLRFCRDRRKIVLSVHGRLVHHSLHRGRAAHEVPGHTRRAQYMHVMEREKGCEREVGSPVAVWWVIAPDDAAAATDDDDDGECDDNALPSGETIVTSTASGIGSVRLRGRGDRAPLVEQKAVAGQILSVLLTRLCGLAVDAGSVDVVL